MKKISSFKFMHLDLVFFTIIALLTDFLGTGVLRYFPNLKFCISLSLLVYCVVLIRWGKKGLIVGLIMGVVHPFYLEGPMLLNFCLSLLPKITICLIGCYLLSKIELKKKSKIALFYGFAYVVSSLTQGVVLYAYSGRFLLYFVNSLTAHLLSLVISIIIICLFENNNGLFKDMSKFEEIKYEI